MKIEDIDFSNATFFYYDVYKKQYDEDENKWKKFEPEASFNTQVVEVVSKKLEGFDVVSFSAGTSAECSPLSCNNLA